MLGAYTHELSETKPGLVHWSCDNLAGTACQANAQN